MGSVTDRILDRHRAFVTAQRMFFVATAPLGRDGHVNLSPKGLDSFRVLDERTIAWLDFPGSGAETIAHVRENGRVCVMFCAFAGNPGILRFHGRGSVVEPGDAEFAALRAQFPAGTGTAVRAILRAEVHRVAESCGFGVPLYDVRGDRDRLPEWCARKGEDGVRAYQREKNATSLDGLPALRWVERGE
ncbi:MAG: pyridoxamine 5'-phosphate oxidase family protein [Planctomycetota bacterium]